MSKGVYIGVNGVARKDTKGYLGVSGVSRKVSRAYLGVAGVARQCFNSVAKYLYNLGDKCSSITGGWSVKGAHWGYIASGGTNGYISSPTIVDNGTYMTVNAVGNYGAGYIYTVKKIDLTNYSALCADVVVTGLGDGGCKLFVTSSLDGADATVYKVADTGFGASYSGTVSLNVSGLTGSYYVCIWIASAGPSYTAWSLRVNSIHLET